MDGAEECAIVQAGPNLSSCLNHALVHSFDGSEAVLQEDLSRNHPYGLSATIKPAELKDPYYKDYFKHSTREQFRNHAHEGDEVISFICI